MTEMVLYTWIKLIIFTSKYISRIFVPHRQCSLPPLGGAAESRPEYMSGSWWRPPSRLMALGPLILIAMASLMPRVVQSGSLAENLTPSQFITWFSCAVWSVSADQCCSDIDVFFCALVYSIPLKRGPNAINRDGAPPTSGHVLWPTFCHVTQQWKRALTMRKEDPRNIYIYIYMDK